MPQIPKDQFPTAALGWEVYVEAGVRGATFGSLVFTTIDEKTGKPIPPKNEFYRLAVPRRVYTDRHMDWVVVGLRRVYKRRDKVRGVKIAYMPPGLPMAMRHFLAHFELV